MHIGKSYSGTVLKGENAGTRLGFPTANIPLDDSNLSGIYAAIVKVDGGMHEAAVYANQRRRILEAHLLDFSGNLYGKEISVTLHEKIRDDKAFSSFSDETALSQRIAEDIREVQEYFKKAR